MHMKVIKVLQGKRRYLSVPLAMQEHSPLRLQIPDTQMHLPASGNHWAKVQQGNHRLSRLLVYIKQERDCTSRSVECKLRVVCKCQIDCSSSCSRKFVPHVIETKDLEIFYE